MVRRREGFQNPDSCQGVARFQANRSFETLHAEGKSRREATRLLKRYLARRLYRLLENREPLLA